MSKLQCKLCKQLLYPSNPPYACKTHLIVVSLLSVLVRKQTYNSLPQREHVCVWKEDRLQDAKDCLVAMAEDAGPALREELR